MSQKPNPRMKKENLERVIKRLDELSEFGVLNRDEEVDENGEHGYGITEKFKKLVDKHYRLQSEIENMDKQNGVDSTKEYGFCSREEYIVGISLNDFLNYMPPDCEKCKGLALNRDGDFMKLFEEHMEKEHPEHYKRNKDQEEQMSEWVNLINHILNQTKEKVWRSTV